MSEEQDYIRFGHTLVAKVRVTGDPAAAQAELAAAVLAIGEIHLRSEAMPPSIQRLPAEWDR